MSSIVVALALGCLLGGGLVAIATGRKEERRDWTLVVLVSCLIVGSLIGIGWELLSNRMIKNYDGHAILRSTSGGDGQFE